MRGKNKKQAILNVDPLNAFCIRCFWPRPGGLRFAMSRVFWSTLTALATCLTPKSCDPSNQDEATVRPLLLVQPREAGRGSARVLCRPFSTVILLEIPRQHVETCFPPATMSQIPPMASQANHVGRGPWTGKQLGAPAQVKRSRELPRPKTEARCRCRMKETTSE